MNVAVVKLSSIGDVIHALPVAAALKRAHPAARVTWVAEAREATLLAGHPDVDEVVVADTRGWRARPGMPSMREALAVVRGLRARAFDVTLDLQGLFKSGMLTALTRAPRRIGFAGSFRRERASVVFTNERVTPPAHARHVVEQYLELLAPMGIADRRVDFRLVSDPAANARVEQFLAGAGLKPRDRLVLLNPGAGRPDKRWPVTYFGALARGLAETADARAIVLWGPGEEADARAIAGTAPGATVAPPTDLRELVALTRRATLAVAGDTGPLHIAAALGVPCVGLFGPTSPVRNGPYGIGHEVVTAADGRLASIDPRTALAAAGRILEAAA
jgi:heptosyltransferase I